MGSHASARRAPAHEDAQRVFDSLRRLVRFLRLGARRAEDSTGASSAQLFVLHQLAVSPASSLAELAARTLTDASSVSTVAARLVERKLVERRRGTDRRKSELALTAKGRALVARTPDLPQMRILAALVAAPPAQRRALERGLAGLLRSIGADELEPRMLFEDEKR